MQFKFNKGTNLTTFHSDLNFTRKIGQLFNIPQDYVHAWYDHYISVEFMSPVNLDDKVTVRIYTKQELDPRLPLSRDVGDPVTNIHVQSMSPAYILETDGHTINKFRDDVVSAVGTTNFKPHVVQNINNLQQKVLLEDNKFEVNLTKLTTREAQIDQEAFTKNAQVVTNTSKCFNNKFLEKTRITLEKEIIIYDKSNYMHPKNTYDFYQGASSGFQYTISDPKAPAIIKHKCQQLDFQTKEIAKIIKKHYNL